MESAVVVVTGGARGLGLAIAERFVGAGAKVTIADVDEAAVADAAAAIGADHLVCDVTARESVQALVDTTVGRHARLDVFVANAGIASGGSLLEVTDDDWRRIIDVDLTGVFLCDQVAGRRMVDQGHGVILNMASIMGACPHAQTVAYGAAKAGVINLTQSAALALAPHGVRVNAIGPGYMETRMTEPIRADPGIASAVTARVPLGRFGTPGNVADAALFLASDQASFVTGQVLYVDGGWLLHPDASSADQRAVSEAGR